MEERKKAVPLPWKILLTCVMTQDSKMKNYGKANMYLIPREARILSWTQNIKGPIEEKSCQAVDEVQPKTSPFSTLHLIWVN